MSRTTQGDRGATLVELAIVGLIVFTMLLAMFEFGLLFRDNLTATDAVADAARIGSIMGPDVAPGGATGDFEIVRALREGLSSMGEDDIETIVIFRSPGTSEDPVDQVPVQCRQGTSVKDLCNVYDPSGAFEAVAYGNHDYFTCNTPGEVSCHWDPTDRVDGPKSSDVQTIGVYVRIERSGYTGLFADSWTITRAATARLEPGVTDP